MHTVDRLAGGRSSASLPAFIHIHQHSAESTQPCAWTSTAGLKPTTSSLTLPCPRASPFPRKPPTSTGKANTRALKWTKTPRTGTTTALPDPASRWPKKAMPSLACTSRPRNRARHLCAGVLLSAAGQRLLVSKKSGTAMAAGAARSWKRVLASVQASTRQAAVLVRSVLL